MADDARRLPNTALLETSFLYGANAGFVEEMHARYLDNPNSVDASWRAFFASLKDEAKTVKAAVAGPSWYRADLAQPKATETTALLDGNWQGLQAKIESKTRERLPEASIADVQAAARDSIRALMMIRGYRTRGHLAADLDPLHLEQRLAPEELEPASYGFSPEDWDRPIFIDGVLGLQFATV